MSPTCLLYVVIGVASTVQGFETSPNCDHLGVLLYEDLGCVPHYEEGNPCPNKFSCSSFASHNDTCLFRGKTYKAGQQVADSFIAENCFFDCKCVNPAGYQKYECGVRNCTEWTRDLSGTECYQKFAVDECCSVGTVCYPKKNETHECQFEGTIYREGELFLPSNTCNKCSCRRGFRGIVEEPFCKRSLCATQVIYFEELENYCAPLYLPSSHSTALCCPNEWVCYSPNDTMIDVISNINPNFNLYCNFGPKMISVGEGFTNIFDYYGTLMNVTCECILPPFMTCKPS